MHGLLPPVSSSHLNSPWLKARERPILTSSEMMRQIEVSFVVADDARIGAALNPQNLTFTATYIYSNLHVIV